MRSTAIVWNIKKFLAVRTVWALWPFASDVLTVRFPITWIGYVREPSPPAVQAWADYKVRSLNPPPRRKALNLWNRDFSTSIQHTNHGILYQFQLQHTIKQIQLIMNSEEKVSWTILGKICAERCFREFVKFNNLTKMHNEALFC